MLEKKEFFMVKKVVANLEIFDFMDYWCNIFCQELITSLLCGVRHRFW